jgi:glutaminyl-peptide cyclotransferase
MDFKKLNTIHILLTLKKQFASSSQQKNILFLFVVLSSFCSCNHEQEKLPIEQKAESKTEETKEINVPSFHADSAYAFVAAQVAFGPRVPGTDAHAKCADYLMSKLKLYGAQTQMQSGTVSTYDGKKFKLKNIIASFNSESKKRILICSHWDTRPVSEKDKDKPNLPSDGANDGASGVGVALEIARQISEQKPNVGVDIIFFDLEDYGKSGYDEGKSTWCLGSQYWAQNLHQPNYYANYGILLDMVGGYNAQFVKEGISVDYAPTIVDKVWKTASNIGYNNYFIADTKYFLGEDDHKYINLSGTPCIDIIQYNTQTGAFPDYHHTHKDNMDAVDKNTLKAVGQTLLTVIYSEK